MNTGKDFDLLRFAQELPAVVRAEPWKILVVDDDPAVLAVTRLALADFEVQDRPLYFLEANSGADALSIMRDHPDVALIFMDVVMESEHAGLEAVDIIRNTLGNSRTRIVLRTGQPGLAPEEGLVAQHGINDYAAKTELTATRLKTLVHARLQDYSNLSMRDPQTGLFSRSFLDGALPVEQARARHSGSPFAVAIFTLDRFGNRDVEGHRAGADSTAFKAFSALLTREARKQDIACRYGVESIAVVMPGTSEATALRVADAIRHAWEASPTAREADGMPPLTVSVALAVFPQHARSPQALLRAANEAMSRARSKGGNRCELATGTAQH